MIDADVTNAHIEQTARKLSGLGSPGISGFTFLSSPANPSKTWQCENLKKSFAKATKFQQNNQIKYMLGGNWRIKKL